MTSRAGVPPSSPRFCANLSHGNERRRLGLFTMQDDGIAAIELRDLHGDA